MNTPTNKASIDIGGHAGSTARDLRIAREGGARPSLYVSFRPGSDFRQKEPKLTIKRQAPQRNQGKQPSTLS